MRIEAVADVGPRLGVAPTCAALDVSRGDVVDTGVAEHHVPGALRRDARGDGADHHAELRLVLAERRLESPPRGPARREERAVDVEEDDGDGGA